MEKLKFSKDEGSLFYSALTQRINTYFEANGLSHRGGSLMAFKICLYFGLVALFYILTLASPSLAAFYIFYLLMGVFVLLTAFNVSHDAAHGVAVKNKKLNDFLFELSFNLQGNNAYIWKKYHNESHHLYTNIEGSDIDVLNNPLIRMTDTQPLKGYHKYQHLYAPFLYLLYSLNWFLFRETLMAIGYSSRTITIKIPRKEIIKLFTFKLVYLFFMIALPIWVVPFTWVHILWAFLLNHLIVSVIFTSVLGVSHLSDHVEHPQPDENGRLNMSWPKLQMITSADYNSSSVFLNWTLGGFNAHAIHHLLPNICHVHYLKIVPIFRETAKEFGVEYIEMPYYKALQSHFRFLKKMGNGTTNK
ncbi:MAG: acyl-CoA desaturase [Bacteroidetes bacterium]|nr:MAG: acyl-CoA desaturase [Bacteroidota bacterium]